MLAIKTLPETASNTSLQPSPVLNGFTATLLGYEQYFFEIEAQVNRALAIQNGARQ